MWNRAKKHFKSADITFDREDREWFLHIKKMFWRFDSHGRGFVYKGDGTIDVSCAVIFVDYYPPHGGNVRFDIMMAGREYPELLQEYAEALRNYGHAGKNRLSYFEERSVSAPEIVKSFWKRLFGF